MKDLQELVNELDPDLFYCPKCKTWKHKDELTYYGQDGKPVCLACSPLSNFVMPLIRSVFPKLITDDLVSVQPMDTPVGLRFYLAKKYSHE